MRLESLGFLGPVGGGWAPRKTAVARAVQDVFQRTEATSVGLHRPRFARADAPPPTRTVPVVDDYHGHKVADPYRWLENSADPEVQAWVQAQNAFTESRLKALPGREQLAARLTEVLSVKGISVPEEYEGFTLFSKREPGQNHAVLCMKDAAGVEKVLVDPNSWSEKGTEALDWSFISRDGRYLAYGRSSNGSEDSTLHLLDTRTGQHLPEVIPDTRACSLSWLKDGSGFYYTRYPAAGTVPPGEEQYHRHVFFHQLGTDPAGDPKVFGDLKQMEHWPNVQVDGNHVLVSVSRGWAAADLHLVDRRTGERTTLVEGIESNFEPILKDGKIYVRTDFGAPRYRLLEVDVENPKPLSAEGGSLPAGWRELIPESRATLEGVTLVGNKLVVQSMDDASSRLVQYDRATGARETEVELPGLGSVGTVSATGDESGFYYSYSSFNQPSTVFRRDLATGETTLHSQVEVPGFDPQDYDVKQEWFTSKDGTRVPMFLVHRKGLELDGDNPTVLYGYGGFNVSMTPWFGKTVVPFLEAGGVFAVANLRGGGEFGKEWHEGGMREHKQNVFDDFRAAGHHLVDRGYTSPSRLAIEGGSNGGLLVGATLVQEPGLFAAAVSEVPLLDMLRYDQFSIARLWIPEYGTAQDPAMFPSIRAWSPLHNVKDGQPYPATLLMSGSDDSRVDPLHARKMAARMQAATAGTVLLREEAHAGHGQGKPVSKTVEAETDKWSFLYHHLGVKPQAPPVPAPALPEPAPARTMEWLVAG